MRPTSQAPPPGMTQEQHGPGFMSLESFVAERLAEEPATDRRGEREVQAKRQVLEAYVRSKPFIVH